MQIRAQTIPPVRTPSGGSLSPRVKNAYRGRLRSRHPRKTEDAIQERVASGDHALSASTEGSNPHRLLPKT